MTIYKRLISLFYKSNDDNNLKEVSMPESPIEYEDLDSDKIEMLLKKYSCKDKEELAITLKEKEMRCEDLSEDELIFYENPEWDYVKSFAELGFTLHREQLYGRSLAIRELIQNQYEVLLDEHGNPFKELINFTLNYFEQYLLNKPNEAESLLIQCFPIMHKYICRQILQERAINDNDINIDEQKAYDEFLEFCKKVFCSLYPEKSTRDLKIRQHFQILANDLISYIENNE